jgi:hypothetical protein
MEELNGKEIWEEKRKQRMKPLNITFDSEFRAKFSSDILPKWKDIRNSYIPPSWDDMRSIADITKLYAIA